VSATIGKGYHSLLPKVADLRKEYFEVFLPELMGSDFKDKLAEKEDEGMEDGAEEGKGPKGIVADDDDKEEDKDQMDDVKEGDDSAK
jgi:hypothetical protein